MPYVVLLGLLPFVFIVGAACVRAVEGADRARAILEAFLAFVVIGYAATEALSALRALAFYPLLAVWLIANAWVGYRLAGHRDRLGALARCPKALPFFIVAAFLAVALFIALTTEPSNVDSLTYHLPRIEHWVQNGTIAFYRTWIERQNEYGPLAETLLLQTRVLGGSHDFYSLVQWTGMVVALAGAFRITGQLGGTDPQKWIAAVFAVTLPIGILESVSTQNDYVLAALLVCFVSFGLDAISRPQVPTGLVLASVAAGALSGLVKPVGYLLGIGFALWFTIAVIARGGGKRLAALSAAAIVLFAVIAGPFTARYFTGGGGAEFRLGQINVNASFGIRQTLDNLIRDAALNFATGVPAIDSRIDGAMKAVTARLGLDTHRIDTSFYERLEVRPRVGLAILHEDFAPNPVHGALLIVAFALTAVRWPAPPSRRQLLYWGAWLTGLVVFAAIIRWNEWQTRYHLSGFVLAAPLVALVWPPAWSQTKKTTAFVLVLALTGLPALLLNRTRQLLPIPEALIRRALPSFASYSERAAKGLPSYLSTSRTERLLANGTEAIGPYQTAIDALARSGASQIGLVSVFRQYPVWWMLRERRGSAPFRIEQVGAPSSLPYPLGPFTPEIIVWTGRGEAPASLFVDGEEFRRAGPTAREIALYTPARFPVSPP